MLFLLGSPPRLRGTFKFNIRIHGLDRITPAFAGNILIASIKWLKSSRITPACAGNIWTTKFSENVDEDHPRVCGEHFRIPNKLKHLIGSPPRVRGTCCQDSRRTRDKRDHPRVCGEHYRHSLSGGRKRGSPPRVRGTFVCSKPVIELQRITPACAGNIISAKL